MMRRGLRCHVANHRLRAGTYVELLENVLQMAAHGIDTEVQFIGNHFVGITLGQQPQYLLFPYGKMRRLVPVFRLSTKRLDDSPRNLTRHGSSATQHIEQGHSRSEEHTSELQ